MYKEGEDEADIEEGRAGEGKERPEDNGEVLDSLDEVPEEAGVTAKLQAQIQQLQQVQTYLFDTNIYIRDECQEPTNP